MFYKLYFVFYFSVPGQRPEGEGPAERCLYGMRIAEAIYKGNAIVLAFAKLIG